MEEQYNQSDNSHQIRNRTESQHLRLFSTQDVDLKPLLLTSAELKDVNSPV